jgi:mono/diheme cytochrome c family protein
MWAINLRIGGVVIGTLLVYTVLANSIPQVQSEVPKQISMGADVTPEQLAQVGEQIYAGAGGCTACHGLGERAPNLLTDDRGSGLIGARCANRMPGHSCKEYLHESLVEPGEFVVAGFQPIMPDVSRTLPPEQIWALVAFLESVGGTVTVTGADLPTADTEGSHGDEGGGGGGFLAGGSADPTTLLNEGGCMGCHQLAGEGGALGPDLTKVGGRLNAAKIREAILDPAGQASPGYESLTEVMPKTFGDQLSAAQLESLVRFLAAKR